MQKTYICSALIVKDNKYLLVKSKTGAPKGLWNNPGGHKDEGESDEETVKRELLEETNFLIELGKLIGTYTWQKNEEELIIKKVYEAKIVGGKLFLPEEEIEEVKWFSKDEIENKDLFTFGAVKSIEDYEEGKFNQEYISNKVP
jgi:ADP-ribose pyrophosphatase YjhB (NUDIX family)